MQEIETQLLLFSFDCELFMLILGPNFHVISSFFF